MINLEEKTRNVKNEIRESFLISILMIIFALVLLFKADDIISTLVIIVGFIGLVYGSFHILFYFRLEKPIKFYSNNLFKGIVMILFGGIAILKNLVFADMITYIIGLYIIYRNASRFQVCCNYHETGTNKWKYLAGISLGNVFLGTFIILNPFTQISITTIIAVCVMVSEIVNLVQNIVMLVGMRKKDGREEK